MADLTIIDVFLKGPMLRGEIWLSGVHISKVLFAAIKEPLPKFSKSSMKVALKLHNLGVLDSPNPTGTP